jgi:hypothetical protein
MRRIPVSFTRMYVLVVCEEGLASLRRINWEALCEKEKLSDLLFIIRELGISTRAA